MKRFLLVLLIFLMQSMVSWAQYNVQKPFPDLSIEQPNTVTFTESQPDWIFIVSQKGNIIRLDRTLGSEASSVDFLDISAKLLSGGEQGLLGLAFHPDFANNGYFYVDYTAANPRRTVIERYQADPKSLKADANSGHIILEVNQPYSNHNAGDIAFGPDGYLYITLGDGGSGGDPDGNGQNRNTLLGSILRIDVDNPAEGQAYGIPQDNPFVGNTEGWKEEIWAYGLRNPWRFAFDSETGELWAADVGQNAWEEINIISKGGNYGWNIMEGFHCYPPGSECDSSGLQSPVWEYPHTEGNRSITGGRVYRGNRLSALTGAYIYADFVSGRIWALYMQNGNAKQNELLLDSNLSITSFGTDADNNLYISSYDGTLYQLTAPTAINQDPQQPTSFNLAQNYPNPFNHRTTIEFTLDRSRAVRLDIINIKGQRITQLFQGRLSAGTHRMAWNGKDNQEQFASSGVYMYRLLSGNKIIAERKMLYLK